MRRRGAVLLAGSLAAVLALGAPATPQDAGAVGQPHYWPHRTFYIPVNVARIAQADPKPTHLQLYSSLNRGPWKEDKKLPLNGLQNLGEGKQGFQFTADKDGEYEFSVQYWYADGSTSPKKGDELSPMLSVTIDTTPPTVRLSAGANGVEWAASDDNLDPRNVSLECKFPQWTKWQTITDRAFKPADQYAWKLQPGQILEVRVKASDRAGNEGYSPVVRVPGDAAMGTGFGKAPSGVSPDWPPSGGGGTRDPFLKADGNVPQARIEYVNVKNITVDYNIQRVGRSGIKAARLYVQSDQDPGGWKLADTYPVNLQPSDKDQTLSLKYTVQAEGVYGFFVAPESGAGVKADPPRKDEPPMMFVVVDEKDPFVKITGVRVTPGGVRGPLVEIAWEAADQNLMANPVSLEYSVDKNATQWNEIKYRLENNVTKTTGRYAWEVPDENLWKFHVRIRAVDKAANTGKFVWPEEVIVDLEKPAAGITGVRGAGGAAGPGSSSPPPTPRPTAPGTPAPKGPAVPSGPPAESPKLPDLPLPPS